jgi:hypothetical protein
MKVIPSAVERLLYLALLMIFVGTGIAVFLLVQQLNAQGQTSREIKQAVEELKADKAARDKVLIEHIDCIGLFLSQPNRTEIHIEDLHDCKISPQKSGFAPTSPQGVDQPTSITEDVFAVQPSAPTQQIAVSPTKPTTTPTVRPEPTPSPPPPAQPSIVERVVNVVTGLVESVF